ncbi:hypothetical protein QBC46DRAFT_408256 [Diplogelasinospora grovesii]|uniref:Uncharacterized protein n=1 Tax=Diplogelasinospora grovesii TaxID=303347 RepID=A0AAN6S4S8_9PEZI|nr:hypothetical protein QBC46DRAFT_408256 [Diplogelasinospora grovesii]
MSALIPNCVHKLAQLSIRGVMTLDTPPVRDFLSLFLLPHTIVLFVLYFCLFFEPTHPFSLIRMMLIIVYDSARGIAHAVCRKSYSVCASIGGRARCFCGGYVFARSRCIHHDNLRSIYHFNLRYYPGIQGGCTNPTALGASGWGGCFDWGCPVHRDEKEKRRFAPCLYWNRKINVDEILQWAGAKWGKSSDLERLADGRMGKEGVCYWRIIGGKGAREEEDYDVILVIRWNTAEKSVECRQEIWRSLPDAGIPIRGRDLGGRSPCERLSTVTVITVYLSEQQGRINDGTNEGIGEERGEEAKGATTEGQGRKERERGDWVRLGNKGYRVTSICVGTAFGEEEVEIHCDGQTYIVNTQREEGCRQRDPDLEREIDLERGRLRSNTPSPTAGVKVDWQPDFEDEQLEVNEILFGDKTSRTVKHLNTSASF